MSHKMIAMVKLSPKFVFPPSFRKIIHHQTSPHMNEYVVSLMVKCRKILGNKCNTIIKSIKRFCCFHGKWQASISFVKHKWCPQQIPIFGMLTKFLFRHAVPIKCVVQYQTEIKVLELNSCHIMLSHHALMLLMSTCVNEQLEK